MSHVEFDDLKRGDRIRFSTKKSVIFPIEGKKRGRLGKDVIWRTGTVMVKGEKGIRVDCDMPNRIGHGAILRKAVWSDRNVELLQEG